MDGLQIFYITLFMTIINKLTLADHEYVVRSPDSRAVPIDFETVLQCSMNFEPDKFQWKFYPLPLKDIRNPKAIINLSKSNFVIIPNHNFTTQRKQSDLTVQVDATTAGDYQCLAYYGASVVASVPWRITITHLGEFPRQQSRDIVVLRGNTVSWRCEPPDSNPEASIEYSNDNNNIPSIIPNLSKSLIIPNVTNSNNGRYYCTAYSLEFKRKSSTTLTLTVVDNYRPQAPYFIVSPPKSYTVNKGASVFLECSAIGNPIPKVIWKKQSGQIPSERTELVQGGLIIKNITADDNGTYICHHLNNYGELNYQIKLIYNEEPTIDCLSTTTNPTTDLNQGQSADIYCAVKGTPEPEISWFLNGFSVNNDSAIDVNDNRIYFRPVEKRHAGNLQIFAQNVVKTVYSSISIRVIPVSTSIDVGIPPPTKTHHRHHNTYHNNHNNNGNNKGMNNRKSQKHPKIVIPTKPTVSRLNDHAVMVRWTVPPNQGLPIQFFKVQFRDLGPISNQHEQRKAKPWNTSNPDIAPHIRSYEVNDLKPDHVYRFRIAAVYSNNDNKDSPKSDKFYLRRMDFDKRNPLPIPMITQTEPINSTAVKIYWKCDPSPNITINGFLINYVSASSAADYMKATVDGQDTNSFILSHLQPDTVYDIKLQSFTSKSASEFSSIMKARTLNSITTVITATPITTSTINEPITQTTAVEAAGISKLYIIIAVCVLTGGGLLILAIVALLFYCRKWKQKKSRNDRGDKPAVDDHRIQVDGNDYVVNTKNQSRANGVLPPNRITITANPLADADNKNQNMIELSCLASQNNNCSSTTTTATTTTTTTTTPSSTTQEFNDSCIAKDKENKNREKRNIRGKNNLETNTSRENYV